MTNALVSFAVVAIVALMLVACVGSVIFVIDAIRDGYVPAVIGAFTLGVIAAGVASALDERR